MTNETTDPNENTIRKVKEVKTSKIDQKDKISQKGHTGIQKEYRTWSKRSPCTGGFV